MKTKTGLEMRDVCGEKVLIASGIENLDFSKMISLNETAAFLWSAVSGKDFDSDTLVGLLCGEYAVTETQARHDVGHLLAQWEEYGIIGE